jgi:hypothetical protein
MGNIDAAMRNVATVPWVDVFGDLQAGDAVVLRAADEIGPGARVSFR